MDIVSYLASIFIGIALGMMGSGGSILTVPVLTYFFSIDAALATVYSLFIVSITSLIGSFSYFTKGLVNLKTAMVFGVPSIIAVFLARTFIVPAIPNSIVAIGGVTVTKSALLLLLFAVLMLFASYGMIKEKKTMDFLSPETSPGCTLSLVTQGFLVGNVTGIIGAGGGFLIIPTLVNLSRLETKSAIGTSLIIIAFNSLLGFVVSIKYVEIAWFFLFKTLAITTVGVLIGSYLCKKIDDRKLKSTFGWFVLAMGIYIIVKEVLLK